MKDNDEIKDELGKFSSRFAPAIIVAATVTAINEDDTIQVVFADESTLDDVRLKAVVKDGNKYILSPTVGSVVLVGKINNSDEYVVIAVEDITAINLIIGTVKYKVDETGFLFQKDTDTLKDALTLIVDAVKQIFVVEGNNVDYPKLAQAQVKINNILK
jgi:hypothetical protein